MVNQPTDDDKTRLISLPEAAELFGLSPSYLRSLAQKGRLEAQKIGDRWITTPGSVEKYLGSRQRRGRYREDL